MEAFYSLYIYIVYTHTNTNKNCRLTKTNLNLKCAGISKDVFPYEREYIMFSCILCYDDFARGAILHVSWYTHPWNTLDYLLTNSQGCSTSPVTQTRRTRLGQPGLSTPLWFHPGRPIDGLKRSSMLEGFRFHIKTR